MALSEAEMVIVLIHWKIKTPCIDEFLKFWKTEAVVRDSEGLIGEFLTKPSSEKYPWITLNLEHDSSKYVSYVNIGLWSSAKAFEDQIGQYFETKTGPKPFEYKPRSRTLLTPDSWRIGNVLLPEHSSAGVL